MKCSICNVGEIDIAQETYEHIDEVLEQKRNVSIECPKCGTYQLERPNNETLWQLTITSVKQILKEASAYTKYIAWRDSWLHLRESDYELVADKYQTGLELLSKIIDEMVKLKSPDPNSEHDAMTAIAAKHSVDSVTSALRNIQLEQFMMVLYVCAKRYEVPPREILLDVFSDLKEV